jgi:hypothetical protein
MGQLQRVPRTPSIARGQDHPPLHPMGRSFHVRNRMLESGASGSVGGEGGNVLAYPATLPAMPKGKGTSGANREAESTDAPGRGGLPCSSVEAGVMAAEQRGQVIAIGVGSTGNGRNPTINGRRQPSRGGTSRMMREYHVRICEGLGVKFPGPTRHSRRFLLLRAPSAYPPIPEGLRQRSEPTLRAKERKSAPKLGRSGTEPVSLLTLRSSSRRRKSLRATWCRDAHRRAYGERRRRRATTRPVKSRPRAIAQDRQYVSGAWLVHPLSDYRGV